MSRNISAGWSLVFSVALAIALLYGLSIPATAAPAAHETEEATVARAAIEETPRTLDRVDADTQPGEGGGRGVRVAILDTGIDLDHPDLRVAGHVSFVEGVADGDDDNGHGTMVAGIIAALDNDIGMVGVAPEVELYSVKVLDSSGEGVGTAILSGINWAIENDMQVVVMSFGSLMTLPLAIGAALDRAAQAGIVLIAGAGNSGDSGVVFAPASHDAVIAVGATDRQGVRVSFSGTGPSLELMAPGADVLSTSRGGGVHIGNGTSLAASHVAGVAALLIAAGVTDSAELREILRETADDMGPPGWDVWHGYGLTDAAEAIATATDASG